MRGHKAEGSRATRGATGFEERWLAVYDEPRSASVGRLTELPIPRVSQRVFLVSLSEAIRLVRRRANGLGLVLPEPAVSEFSCVGRAVNPVQAIARMKRSPKRMANCALAMHHSRAGMVHSFSDRFKTRNSSFRAASSVGK